MQQEILIPHIQKCNVSMKDFLETEINGDISLNSFLGGAMSYIHNGCKGKVEITGNAYNILIYEKEVFIEHLWDDAKLTQLADVD